MASYVEPKFFENDYIAVQRIRNPKLKIRIVATIISSGEEYYASSGLTSIILLNKNFSLKYLLTLFNSKLMNWYYKQFFTDVNIKPEDLRQLPIKNISLKNQQPFIKLADKMLSLNKKLQEIGDKNTLEKQKIQEEIKKTDNEIDELVYQLYGITEEEKKIIEGSLK